MHLQYMPQFHLRHSYLSFSFPGIMNMIMLKPIALSNQDSWTPCYWLETRFHSICLRKEYWSYFKAYFEGLLAFMNMHCQGHSPQINGLGRPHLAAVGVLLIPNGRWRWLLCLLLPVCFSAVTKPLHPSPDLISQWKYPLPWSMVHGEQAKPDPLPPAAGLAYHSVLRWRGCCLQPLLRGRESGEVRGEGFTFWWEGEREASWVDCTAECIYLCYAT